MALTVESTAAPNDHGSRVSVTVTPTSAVGTTLRLTRRISSKLGRAMPSENLDNPPECIDLPIAEVDAFSSGNRLDEVRISSA